MKFADHFGGIWFVYSNLCDLRKSYFFYEMVKEDIWDVNSIDYYFKDVNQQLTLSQDTIKLRDDFSVKFDAYIRSKKYSADRVFVYLDSDFISILDNELKAFLESFNSDLLRAGFTDVESLDVEEREFPTNEAILERVEFLYELINKKR